MSTPCLPGLFDAGDAPVAPQRVTVQPIAREARASGRRCVSVGATMLEYRDALIAHGPATDPFIAEVLGWGVSSCCGRRGDWNELAPTESPYVVAVDRVKVGKASQARWMWRGPR
jgi:hypothetical protein